MTAIPGPARTARSYLAEFGAIAGAMWAAFVLLLMIALLTSLTAWPAGALLPGERAELGAGGSTTGSGAPEATTAAERGRPPAEADGAARTDGKGIAPERGDQRGDGIPGAGGVDGVGGGSDEVTGGDVSVPTGGASTPDADDATSQGSGNGLKLGHSKGKASNGNGNKVGHGSGAPPGNSGAGGQGTSGAPGQSKAAKKPKG